MPDDTCLNCGNPVRIAIFQGSHYCSAACLAALTGDRAKLPTAPTEQPPKPRQGRCVQ